MGATSVVHIDDSVGNGPALIFDVNNKRDILAYYLDGTEVFAIMSDGFIRTTTGWAYRQIGVGIGDFAADGTNDDYTYPIFRAKHDVTIISAHVACDSAVALNATNYQHIYLEQSGNSNDIGTISTKATAFVKHVPREITIGTTNDQDHLAAGDTLQLRTLAVAAGVAMYGMTVTICYTIDQPNKTIGTATDNVMRFINEIGTAAQFKCDFASRPFMSIRESGNERLHIDITGKMHGAIAAGMNFYACADQYYYQTINTGQLVTADSATKISPLFAPHCTIQLENVYFGAITTYARDSNTNGWLLSITDASTSLVEAYTHLYGSGTDLVKGQLYDMGDINREWGRLTSSDKLCVEYLEAGTGPTTNGLTFTLCYRKVT